MTTRNAAESMPSWLPTGWALAQQPQFLPGLTVDHAAAPRDTLIAGWAHAIGVAMLLAAIALGLAAAAPRLLEDHESDGSSRSRAP